MEIIYKSIRTINYETQQISAIDTPSAFNDYVDGSTPSGSSA